jgi:hypothetical protein
MGLKDPKSFGGNFQSRQAEWEKQMESMDQKQAELFHFQWNLIREQLGSLTSGMAAMRQEVEAFRSTEARREVREADFARVVREVQADLERESTSRRKHNEELIETLAPLKQAVDHERTDRIHSFQAFEKEISTQISNIKKQQQLTLDGDKDLSNRFEHWCMELRATLDKESGARGQKIEDLDRKIDRFAEALDKETRLRIASVEDLTGMQKARDRGADIDDCLSSLKVLSTDLEREVESRRKEVQEIFRGGERTDKEIRELKELSRETASELARGLQAEAEDRRRIDIVVRNLEIQIPSNIENERAERAALIDKLHKRHEDAMANAIEEAERRHNDIHSRHSELKDYLDEMHGKHSGHEENHAMLHGKHEDLMQKARFFEELHQKHEQAFTGLAGRTEEIHALLHDALSRVGPDAEARAVAAVTAALEEAMFVSKLEFQQSVQRLWEALDSHTHDVDVAAMQQNQLQAVQVRSVVRRAPTPPPAARVFEKATLSAKVLPGTATVQTDTGLLVTGVDRNNDGIPDCLQLPTASMRAPSPAPVVMRRLASGSQPGSPIMTEFKNASGSMTIDVNSPSCPTFAYPSTSLVGPTRTTSVPTVRCSSPLSTPPYSLATRNTLPASVTSVVAGTTEFVQDSSTLKMGSTTLGSSALFRR